MYKTMNKLSKPLALVLALVMVLGVTIPALAVEDETPAKPTLEVKVGAITQDGADKVTAEVTVTQTKGKEEKVNYQAVNLTTDLGKFKDADGDGKTITLEAKDFTEDSVGTATATLTLPEATTVEQKGTVTAVMGMGKDKAITASAEFTIGITSLLVKIEDKGNETAEITINQAKNKEGKYSDVTLTIEGSKVTKGKNTVPQSILIKPSTSVKEAQEQLKAVIAQANEVEQVATSTDGKNISIDKEWTTPEEKTDFINAFNDASKLVTNDIAELDKASQVLSKAIADYELAKRDGLNSDLVIVIPSEEFKATGEVVKEIAIPEVASEKQTVKVTATITIEDSNISETVNLEIKANEQLKEDLKTLKDKANNLANEYKEKVSEDGKNVSTKDKWVTQEALDALKAAIEEANKYLAEGANLKITATVVENLQAAIDAFEKEVKDGLTSPEVLEALPELEKAIEDAEAAKKGIKTSEDGSDVAKTDAWTTPKDLKILEDGIAKAKEVLAKEDLDAEEINVNAALLNSITELYNLSKNIGKTPKEIVEAKSKLKETIEKAINNKVAVSVDGKDVLTTDKWTSAKDLAEFEKAIEIAKEALGNKDLDKDALDKNTKYLETAITLYHIAQDNGTLTPAVVDRITGEDIYASSVEVAKAMYPEGAEKVIIATANKEKLADALTAGSLANLYNAPVLLVEGDNVSEVVAEYLADGVKEVTVIGGPNTISPAVFEKLEAMVDSVERIQGSNRFQTAVEVAKLVQKDEAQNKFIVANGEGNEKFVDALSASAVSSVYGYPVLVTSADELVKEATAFLTDSKASEVFVIGGESSIKKAVITDLEKVLDKEAKVERISGTNRNETAVAVAKAFFPEAEQAVFVNGDDNQLVLVAGTYAGSQNAPVILVGQKDVPKPAKEYLPTSAIKDGTVIGSVESVEEIVRLQLEELVK